MNKSWKPAKTRSSEVSLDLSGAADLLTSGTRESEYDEGAIRGRWWGGWLGTILEVLYRVSGEWRK